MKIANLYSKFVVFVFGLLIVVFATSSSRAQASFPTLDELRVGGVTGSTSYHSASLELQALFSPLSLTDRIYNPQLSWLFSPRPIVGASISLDHRTNQVYGGLAWTVPILGPYFVELSAGGLIHDQTLNVAYTDRPSPLSTRVLFRESIALGYNINANWRALVFADHGSNGKLGYRNASINRFGFLIGRRIGAAHTNRPPAVSSAETYNWTGPYAGLDVGLARSTPHIDAPGASVQNSASMSVNLGAMVGYNWSIGRSVVGVEADYSVQSLRGTQTVDVGLPTQQELNAVSLGLFTARSRLGMKIRVPYISDATLLYGTGGVAVGSIANGYCSSATDKCYQNGDVVGGWSEQRATRVGWTAGAGLEVPLSPKVAARFEYLYVDLGSATFTNGSLVDEISFSEHLVRSGVTVKLN